jgi:hypothetical protein
MDELVKVKRLLRRLYYELGALRLDMARGDLLRDEHIERVVERLASEYRDATGKEIDE